MTINIANFYRTRLTADFSPSDTAALLASVDGAPDVPCILVIDVEFLARREVVEFTGQSGNSLTTSSAHRYLAGSTANPVTHPAGASVMCAPLQQHFASISWETLTQAEYDAIVEPDMNRLYIVVG